MAKTIKIDNSNDIPVDGSLGLLAIGYRGVMAWREARKNAGIDIIAIRKKENDEQVAITEKAKAEFEIQKAKLKAERETENKKKKK